jgi:hypothetical protein
MVTLHKGLSTAILVKEKTKSERFYQTPGRREANRGVVDLLDLIREVLTAVKTVQPVEKSAVNSSEKINLAQDNPDLGAG